jgi:tryptophanyl-tRNA synthetase
MAVIFSGIQPTGNLHLGNYLGAIKNWQNIINEEKSAKFFFSVVDLHAITVHQKPKDLSQSILNTFAIYLACGIHGENITLFQQSQVPQHAELTWVLSCNLQMGFLDRMTQYKEKTISNKERACLGLYSYPVLMASDILLYNTTVVPVGEDQIQHIELTQEIATKFNHKYSTEAFILPKAKLTKAKRVMSLKDGTKKMSKSEESDLSRINILDVPEVIAKKIQKAKSGALEMQNLQSIFEAITGNKAEVETGGVAHFKNNLTDAIIAELTPIQNKFYDLMKNQDFLHQKMQEGANCAEKVAKEKLKTVYKTIGLTK